MAGRLQDKVAIITGSSRGLGQYCAVAYAREGAKVAIAARSEENNERLPGTIYETARLVEQAGGEAFPVVCNVADITSVEEMTKQVMDRWGHIDIVMPNAGINPGGAISSMEIRHLELEYRVNVFGTIYAIRAALPAMIAQGSGNIITITTGPGGGGHYPSTKRAVEALTVGLSRELAGNGIAANCLRPTSSIRTPGAVFRRTPEERAAYTGLTSESYEEAAILLAMQTPTTCTGTVANDAQVVERLGSAADLAKFKAMYPPSWTESLNQARIG